MMKNNKNDPYVNGYSGEERRSSFCPVHHIKCKEIEGIESESKKKVPIWVFTLFVSAMLVILGWYNLQMNARNEEVIESLEKHILQSDITFTKNSVIMTRVAHALNEVAYNQRSVMRKIDLEFQEIPDYESD